MKIEKKKKVAVKFTYLGLGFPASWSAGLMTLRSFLCRVLVSQTRNRSRSMQAGHLCRCRLILRILVSFMSSIAGGHFSSVACR